MRKATPARVPGHRFHIISIPAFREEGDIEVGDKVTNEVISIPAFREEGDVVFCEREVFMNISIPAFREEGDGLIAYEATFLPLFQSPPSVRKATCDL